MYHRHSKIITEANRYFTATERQFEMYQEVDEFLRKTRLADSTQRFYGRLLTDFITWIKINNRHGRDLEKATEIDFYDFLNEQTGWSESTCYNSACAIRSFYKSKWGDGHPMMRVRIKRHKPKPQRTLNWEMLEQLLGSLDTSTYKGVRDLSMITMMVDTGLRASEICRLDLKYLNLKENTLKVKIKGGEWGNGAFYEYTHACLVNWLAIRPMIARQGVSAVYVSIGGLKPGTMLTKDGLRSIFRKMGDVSDLGLISPHDMRRTMATLASKAGAPSRVIQVAGRWSSISMVERYTQALQPNDMAPFSPINALMGVNSKK